MKKYWVVVLVAMSLAACDKPVEDHASVTIEVAAQQVACTGITQQRCFKVRFASDQPWKLFYGKIKGFDYQPGFQYQLEVKQQHQKQADPRQSELSWELVQVLKRTKITQAPLPAAVTTVTVPANQ
jgi:hypothetical protein